MNMFRTLTAKEIECRIQQVKPTGLSLLLYKDARCDQNILDETVGPMNWQRRHVRDNANCVVSIWDDKKMTWIDKEDTGTESNTEAQKGLASDSFKRACFNWGIGRELYTAPFIWVPSDKCDIQNGKCYDKFEVSDIDYDGGEIVGLSIVNAKTKAPVYLFGKRKIPMPDQHKASPAPAEMMFTCACCSEVLKPYVGKDGNEVSIRKHAQRSISQFGGKVYCLDCIQSGKAGGNA